jgi:hypothetical protein
VVLGQEPPEPLDHILASFERDGSALRQIVTAGLALTTKSVVQGDVTEQNAVVATPSQLRTINVPASPRSNLIHATLFPECRI